VFLKKNNKLDKLLKEYERLDEQSKKETDSDVKAINFNDKAYSGLMNELHSVYDKLMLSQKVVEDANNIETRALY